jgi:hypothetical protein
MIHAFKIFVSQKGFLLMYSPEEILSLVTPTLQSQPVRQSVADGACPWYIMPCICPFTLRKPTAVAIVPEKLVNASKRKTFSAACTKWSKPAWHLPTFLDCCAIQTSSLLKPPLVFQDPQLRTVLYYCFYGTTILLVYSLSPCHRNYAEIPRLDR